MSLPALSQKADTRSIVERVNRLIRHFNLATEAVVVADLPADVAVGAVALVSDANATTFNSVVAGGGANQVPVQFDGTNWRIR
jgi:hypothetical protein